MINLYVDSSDSDAQELTEQLRELVVAHRIVAVEPGVGVPELGDGAALPAVQEGSTVITGSEEVRQYLKELEQELKMDRSVSGDACYLNPDRPWTCL